VLPHPSYSPALAPSDYHLFGPLKKACKDTIMPMTRHSKMLCASHFRAGTANFTGQEYMLLFKEERRLSKTDGEQIKK
jgi:hypothetical protein